VYITVSSDGVKIMCSRNTLISCVLLAVHLHNKNIKDKGKELISLQT